MRCFLEDARISDDANQFWGRGRSGGSHDCDLCERASLETAADHGWRVGVCEKSRLCLVEMVWVDITRAFLEKEKR